MPEYAMPTHHSIQAFLFASLVTMLARADVVTLVNGDSLRGEVLARDAEAITLRHAVLGDLRIALVVISGIQPERPAEAAAPREQAGTVSPAQPSAAMSGGPAAAPAPISPATPKWKGGFDIGLTGASGNSESLHTRFALAIGRETSVMDTRFDAEYSRSAEDGRVSKNRAEANANNDWRFGDSPWGIFARSRAEYDEFTNYRLRLSGFVGPSYTLYRPEPLLLRFRAGAGGASEFDGPSPATGFRPEGLAGVDIEWTISPRQSVFAAFDYLPSLESVSQFRLDLKAGYQLKIDPRSNMLLKVGVGNRFTSRGGTTQNNDLDYFLTLGWEF